jgi:hypothetical protein
MWRLVLRWLRPTPLDACPACGGDPRRHEIRLLARERLSSSSGVESQIDRGDFPAAAALDDRNVLGDQLVHEVMRCGEQVSIITTEDPVAVGLDARVRRTILLDGTVAELAWKSAR